MTKTRRIGIPPTGYIRVVMDYPIDESAGNPVLHWDVMRGHRVGVTGNTALAPWGRLIHYTRRVAHAAEGTS